MSGIAGLRAESTISQPLIRQQKKNSGSIKLVDYLWTECSYIGRCKVNQPKPIRFTGPRAMDLLIVECLAQSRQQLAKHHDGSWQNTFKQGILLADAKITPYERRQLVARIVALSTDIPVTEVRPLYQLWRDGQAPQLQLAEERQRYSKLQQSQHSELDTLRQQHHVLQQQLELTTRKLENLTDIERQLSTRKPAGKFLAGYAARE
ncbi:two-component system QseEF-associated lipoprotein QseG [Shigella flexneri]